MDRTTEQQQLSHGVSESSENKEDSFMCEDSTLLQIGEILNGTYQITRLIAQGGMGIVYEGIDLFLHRKVAIKVLVTDIDSEDYEKELKLFQTEINLCGNLLHPNIVQIYYAGTYHSLPYLVMEYIDGVPINEYMNKQRCCSWKKVAMLIRNIAKGLSYIHKNNILHRDIKPSNILVTAQGMPILIDFGISIKKNLVGIETNDGELSGTIRYMSPEQVSGQNDQIDERSDIYSLGLILYEILTKHPAYTGSPNEVIGQIFNSSLLPPSEVNINIPESLSNITMKAIAKNVEERYSTAEEFIEDLELYIKNVNNKPIINEVPLLQKAFCYLKPNTAIAISLIWIAFFFIIVTITPLRKYIPENIPEYLRKFISNSRDSFLSILYPPKKTPSKQGSGNSGKENIQKSQEQEEKSEEEEQEEKPQDSPEDDSSSEILTEKKQKTNTSNQREQVSLQPKLEEQIKPEQKKSPEEIQERVTHNPTVIVESPTNTNDSHSNNNDNDNNNPDPELTFREILLNSGEYYSEPGKDKVLIHKKTGLEFIIEEKDGCNIVIFRNSCANGKPLNNYKEICERIYNYGTSFNKIPELKKFQVQKYPFYSIEKLNKNENGKFESENICNENGLYNTQCPFWKLCQSYFPSKELKVIKDLTKCNNCEGYREAYSELLIGLENIKEIYSRDGISSACENLLTILAILGGIYPTIVSNFMNDIRYGSLIKELTKFFGGTENGDIPICTTLITILATLNEFYPDSDSSSPCENLNDILAILNEFYSDSMEEDLKTILKDLREEFVKLMNENHEELQQLFTENHEELQQLFTALQLLYGISDSDTLIPEASLYEELLATLDILSSFFSSDGMYTNLKEIINDATKFDLSNYTLTTTITPQENPISTNETEQPKEIKLTVGFRPLFVFHK